MSKSGSCPKSVIVASSDLLGGMVGLAGLEPATPRLSSVCSNQLSYRPSGLPFIPIFRVVLLVEACGFEPQTFCLQSRRSTN